LLAVVDAVSLLEAIFDLEKWARFILGLTRMSAAM